MIGMQFAHYKIIKGLEKQPLYNLFEAIHQGTGASVVLQAVHPKLIQKKPEVIALLQDEIGELAQIENDFLIKPLNFIQDKNHYFVVYPLEEGMSLKKMLGDQPKPLPLDGILRMFDVLLRGLGMVHTCGHLMWGMTLDSVFVDAEGDAKLRGLGKVLFDYQEQLLGKEKMVEQASFFPPEVFIKKENNSVQSNIYSMGCMMYQLATGEMPFKGDTFFRLEMTHTEGNPFPPQQLKSDLPSDFCEMVLKAIHRNPAKRFQSVLEFHAELVKVRKKRNSDLFDPSFTSGFGDL
jgi:serine/threonine protein kinase